MSRFIRLLPYRVFHRLVYEFGKWKKKNFNLFIRYLAEKHGGSIGELSYFGEDSHITGFEGLRVGRNVQIGKRCWIRAEGGLDIGDNTVISRYVTMYTISHEFEGECLPFDQNMRSKAVKIGKNVWIGMNVNIVPGAQIGDGAIIGMGATIHGVVPEKSIVGSAGWREIGSRDSRHYENLEKSKKYGDANGKPVVEYAEES